ncbi:uncharacterized protein LOC144440232 [Glandiceps talaboti]
MSTKSVDNEDKQPGKICVVCGDKANGLHYRVLSCEGCKTFFRRNVKHRDKLKCEMDNGGHCEMDLYTRRQCPACRMKKCLKSGMQVSRVWTNERLATRKPISKKKWKADESTCSVLSPTSTSMSPPTPMGSPLSSPLPLAATPLADTGQQPSEMPTELTLDQQEFIEYIVKIFDEARTVVQTPDMPGDANADKPDDPLNKADSQSQSRCDDDSQSQSRCDDDSQSQSRCGVDSQSQSRCDDDSQSQSRCGVDSQSQSRCDDDSQSQSRCDGDSQSQTRCDDGNQQISGNSFTVSDVPSGFGDKGHGRVEVTGQQNIEVKCEIKSQEKCQCLSMVGDKPTKNMASGERGEKDVTTVTYHQIECSSQSLQLESKDRDVSSQAMLWETKDSYMPSQDTQWEASLPMQWESNDNDAPSQTMPWESKDSDVPSQTMQWYAKDSSVLSLPVQAETVDGTTNSGIPSLSIQAETTDSGIPSLSVQAESTDSDALRVKDSVTSEKCQDSDSVNHEKNKESTSTTSDTESPNKSTDAMFTHFMEMLVVILKQLIASAKRIFGFRDLAYQDQATLIKASILEIMMLGGAEHYEPEKGGFTNDQNSAVYGKEAGVKAGFGNIMDTMLEFSQTMSLLKLTHSEYCLLYGMTILSPDREGLLDRCKVEQLQQPFVESLLACTRINHGENKVIFAKIVSKLTQLRNFSEEYTDHVLGLQLKGRTFTPLVAELFGMND